MNNSGTATGLGAMLLGLAAIVGANAAMIGTVRSMGLETELQLIQPAFLSITLLVLTLGLTHLNRQQIRRATAEARATADQFRLALLGSRRAMWAFDPASGRMSYSAGWEQVIGLEKQEFAGTITDWEDRLSTADIDTAAAALAQLQGGADTVDFELWFQRTPSSRARVHVTACLSVAPDGERRIIGTFRDVTEERAATQALIASEQRLRAHLEHSPIGVVVVDGRIRLTEVNPVACELFGRPRERLLGSDLVKLFRPIDRPRLTASISRGGEELASADNLCLTLPDGSVRRLRLRAARAAGHETIVWIDDIGPERLARGYFDTQLRLSSVARSDDLDSLLFTALDCLANQLECEPIWLAVNGTSYHLAEAGLALGEPPAALRDAADATSGSPRLRVEVVHGAGGTLVLTADRGAVPFSRAEIAHVHAVLACLADQLQVFHAHRALRSSESRLSRAEALAGLGSWTYDLTSERMEFSPNLHGLLFGDGRPPHTLAELSLAISSDEGWLADVVAGRESTRPPTFDHLVRRDRGARWIRNILQVERDFVGRLSRLIGTVQDVTDEREAEDRLHAANEHLELSKRALSHDKEQLRQLVTERTVALEQSRQWTSLILESTGEGILGVSRSGQIVVANRAAAALLRQPLDGIVGSSFANVLGALPTPEAAETVQRALETGTSQRIPMVTLRREDGTPVPVAVTAEPFTDAGRAGAVVTLSDVSTHAAVAAELRSARDAAQHLAEMRSMFLANMSHEIRTPLNSILGLAQIGCRDHRDDGATETFQSIIESGHHLLAVVNEVLDYSKIEAGKLSVEHRVFTVAEVVDRAVDLVTIPSGKKLDFRVDEAPDVPATMTGDAWRLAQVLVNLLSNAVKFTPARGRVTLKVRRQRDPEGGADQIVFLVSDTGIGMTQEQVGRLFQPFEQADAGTTRRFGGTGLGLSITAFLVDRMGGRITVRSAVGAGSEFTVTFPLTGEDAPAPSIAPATITLVGLEEEEGWIRTELQARGFTIADLHPSDELLPDILVMMTCPRTPEELAWVQRAQADGTQVLCAAPDASEARGNFPVIRRPLRIRHILCGTPRHHAPVGAPRLEGLEVLAIEDNAVNRPVLEAILAGEGAHPVCVEDGLSAVELVRSRPPGSFHVVLTDVSMPGIDGYETARRLLALQPTLPILALTAHALPGIRERCLEVGMVGYLTKPILIHDLVSSLLGYLPTVDTNPTPKAPPRVRTIPPEPPVRSEARLVKIDWDRLAAELPGGRVFVDRLARVAGDTTRELPSRLRSAAAAGDAATIRRVCHELISVAGTFRVQPLVDQCRAAEQAAMAEVPNLAAVALGVADHVDAFLGAVGERPSAEAGPSPADQPTAR